MSNTGDEKLAQAAARLAASEERKRLELEERLAARALRAGATPKARKPIAASRPRDDGLVIDETDTAPLPASNHPVPDGPNEIDIPPATVDHSTKIKRDTTPEERPTSKPSAANELVDVTVRDQVQTLMDEYLAARAEVEAQTKRLINLVGGEENLTEDDRRVLENIRDLVLTRYERLLET